MSQILYRLVLIEKQQKEVMEDLKKYLKKSEDGALERDYPSISCLMK